jgi:hypothetical protein
MKQSTAKALIVRTAKAHGVKNQASDAIPALGRLRGLAVQLGKKGAGRKEVASAVYTKEELFALAKGLRGVLDQVQNIPEDKYSTIRDEVVRKIDNAIREASNAVYGLNKGDTARGVSYRLDSTAAYLETAIAALRRSYRPT